MAQFEPLKEELEKRGAQLILVAAEKRDGVWKPAKFLEKHPVSFPFLLDEDRAVTKAYGVYHRIGKDAIDIAHPATLVIAPKGADRRGAVQYIYRGDNQLDRAPVEEVMAAVRKLT
jgi:peroxiredoxin